MYLGSLYINLDDYELGKEIGKGSFGTVYMSKDRKTGNDVAIKVFHNRLATKKEQEVFLREVVIPNQIKSMGIVDLLGFRFPLIEDEKKDAKEIASPIIVTEYIPNGSLKDINQKYLSSSEVLPNFGPTERTIAIFGIAAIMMKAHRANVIHRDLTLGNILLDENMYPKIGDFGCARTVSNETDKTLVVGTPFSMAPELMESPNYDKSIDVYSYGILLYSLFTNDIELDDGIPIKSSVNLMLRVGNGVRPKKPSNMPKFYWDLAQSCWSHSPKDRPTFARIVDKFLENDEMALFEKGVKTDLLKLHDYQKLITNEDSLSRSGGPRPMKSLLSKSNIRLTTSVNSLYRKQKFNWRRH